MRDEPRQQPPRRLRAAADAAGFARTRIRRSSTSLRSCILQIELDEAGYHAASFLDDRILGPGTKGAWLPIERVAATARLGHDARPLHYILHTGHVGSTLLSRLLDTTGSVLSLREPLPLRTLADAGDVLGQPESLLSESQFELVARHLHPPLESRLPDDALRRAQGNQRHRSRGAVAPATQRSVARRLPQPAGRTLSRHAAGRPEFARGPAWSRRRAHAPPAHAHRHATRSPCTR